MKSMTGFGRGVGEDEHVLVTCEVKQVNHRFLDVWLRMPEAYGPVEHRFRSLAAQRTRRGRIEVRLARTVKPSHDASDALFDDDAIARAIAALTHLKDSHGIPGVIDLRTLVSFPGLHDTFTSLAPPKDSEVEVALEALEEALRAAHEMRVEEGTKLKEALIAEIDALEQGSGRIKERSTDNARAVLARLKERLAELTKDITVDEQRAAEEAALYAERMDITEELARIESHLAQLRSFLESTQPVGKRIDFLLQELMREINTVGSKSRDAAISHEVVELKAALERAREQTQNVE